MKTYVMIFWLQVVHQGRHNLRLASIPGLPGLICQHLYLHQHHGRSGPGSHDNMVLPVLVILRK
jgi:hypothetical protein